MHDASPAATGTLSHSTPVPDTQRLSDCLAMRLALEMLHTARGDRAHYALLAELAMRSRVFAGLNVGAEYEGVIDSAQRAIASSAETACETRRCGLADGAFERIAALCDVHDAQLEVVTFAEYQALREASPAKPQGAVATPQPRPLLRAA
jgi:hypothetical protein